MTGVVKSATQRVSVEDLAWAAGWMQAYEGDDGVAAGNSPDSEDEMVLRARRVAAWLDAEVARREREVLVSRIVTQAGGDPKNPRHRATARRSLARHEQGVTTGAPATAGQNGDH